MNIEQHGHQFSSCQTSSVKFLKEISICLDAHYSNELVDIINIELN